MPSIPWVDAIKARTEKATPGPWVWEQTAEKGYGCHVGAGAFAEDDEDAERPLSGNVSDRTDDLFVETGICETHHQNSQADAEFIAHAREDIPRLLRAVEVLGEAVEKSAARVFEPDEFADEDEGWTCEECGGSWITPSEEAHAEWCTVGVARRALAEVRSLPSAPGATEE